MKPLRALYTRADYLRLPEGFPAQLVRGHLVKEPGATYGHQSAASRIHALLLPLVGADRVLEAPLDVPIDEHNVYQPDVAVFAEPPRRRAPGTVVPLVVFEVASPSSRARDRGFKRQKYLEAGVAEVWTVDEEAGRVEVHTPSGVATARGREPARSAAIPGFALVPDDLFA